MQLSLHYHLECKFKIKFLLLPELPKSWAPRLRRVHFSNWFENGFWKISAAYIRIGAVCYGDYEGTPPFSRLGWALRLLNVGQSEPQLEESLSLFVRRKTYFFIKDLPWVFYKEQVKFKGPFCGARRTLKHPFLKICIFIVGKIFPEELVWRIWIMSRMNFGICVLSEVDNR